MNFAQLILRRPAHIEGTRVLYARSEFECSPAALTASRWSRIRLPGDDDVGVRVVVLNIDGSNYWFQERPASAEHSGTALRHIRICTQHQLRGEMEPVDLDQPIVVTVRTRRRPDGELLFGVCETTGLVVFEIGTETSASGEPMFVSSWTPEGSAPDWLITQEDAA